LNHLELLGYLKAAADLLLRRILMSFCIDRISDEDDLSA